MVLNNTSNLLPESPNFEKAPAPKGSGKMLVVLAVFVMIVVVAATGYFLLAKPQKKPTQQPVNESTVDSGTPFVAYASQFATYEEFPVKVTPKVASYSVNKDMTNVSNSSDFSFSTQAKELLVKNAFVVKPAYHDEFFPLYESNRYSYTPNFITTDSMLHNYHLYFDFLLKQLEEQKLSTVLRDLNKAMLSESLSQYNLLKGTEWENAAKRNVGFFAVGSKLLDSLVAVPSFVATEVDQELSLISKHEGIAISPLMNLGSEPDPINSLKEDYSQYIPRGHYDKTDVLKAYFKSMMWYGRMTFRLKAGDEIKSAMLITLALSKGSNQKSWNDIYEPTNFFVGKSDDITYNQLSELIDKVYGANATVQSVTEDKEKFASFVEETKTLDPPQINSMPIFNSKIQPDREKEIKGFRFMGQRFTIDAAIFQRLVDRETPDRMLPKGLDIPSALGSKEALNILTAMGETKYANYSENMQKMQTHVSGLPTAKWTQNLYWGWMYQLRPLLDVRTAGYPSFMQNNAWVRKDLNTFLGSWSELKHDTILYAKQVYAEMGAGGPDEKDDRGYVEPNPLVYARLASLLKMTEEGLEARGLLSPSMKDNLDKLKLLSLSLRTISEKELNNEKLTDEEYELIRSYGGQLEHFWLEVNKDEPAYKESSSQRDYLNENPAAIVSDVATDPNGSVLEEGTGRIYEIFVVVPVDGKLKLTKGGVYSYYEFAWPLSDRLTDTKWREMLNSEKAPKLPEWTSAYIAE